MKLGVAESCPDVTPDPDMLADVETLTACPLEVCADNEALPATAILPETAPVDCGVNSTLNVVLWPGFRLNGSVKPLMLKLELLADAWLTVTTEPPVFVSETLSV